MKNNTKQDSPAKSPHCHNLTLCKIFEGETPCLQGEKGSASARKTEMKDKIWILPSRVETEIPLISITSQRNPERKKIAHIYGIASQVPTGRRCRLFFGVLLFFCVGVLLLVWLLV